MSTPNDGGPAFPQPFQFRHSDGQPMFPTEYYPEAGGMTLRDYFAAKALPITTGESSCTIESAAKELGIPTKEYDCEKHWPILASRRAYAYADAMLAARNGGTK